jgi:hypothetical protein
MSVVIFVFGGPGLGNQRYAKREGEKFSFHGLGFDEPMLFAARE